jgi:hypothetical protein
MKWKFYGLGVVGCTTLVDGLDSEIELFLEMKGEHYPQLCDYNWMCDFEL